MLWLSQGLEFFHLGWKQESTSYETTHAGAARVDTHKMRLSKSRSQVGRASAEVSLLAAHPHRVARWQYSCPECCPRTDCCAPCIFCRIAEKKYVFLCFWVFEVAANTHTYFIPRGRGNMGMNPRAAGNHMLVYGPANLLRPGGRKYVTFTFDSTFRRGLL